MVGKIGRYWGNGQVHDGIVNTNLCGGQQFWANGEPSKLLEDNEAVSPGQPGRWRIDPVFLGTNTS